MNDNTTTEARETARVYRPRFTLFKANEKGTGAALEIELHPAHDQVDGCLMARMASQMTVGDRRGPNPRYPRFDWENALTVKLGFGDICQMLQVFRGECEELGNGTAVFHRSPRGLTKINLRHLIDPASMYAFEVVRMPSGDNGERVQVRIMISSCEATGLVAAIENSMSVICFGLPMVIAHDTGAYRKAVREMSHGARE